MADSSLQSLLSTKAALDLGLISQADFDAVKNSFLRAQQIKSAVDVGLIKAEDYEETKQSFLGSLIGGAPTPVAVVAPQITAPPVAAPVAAARPPTPSTSQQNLQQLQQPLQPPAPAAEPAAHSPTPRPAPVAWQIPPPAPPAPQGAAAAAAAATAGVAGLALKKSPSNADVPSNIPRMGGMKHVSSGTSMSGIAVTEDAVNLFYLMRLKATYKWALWQVDDSGTQVIIAAVGDKSSTWADFLAALPDSDCRYGVYDFDFTTADGQKLHKMIFLNWAPDSARVKAKMMYASTKDFFKSHLDGLSLEFQASDLDEVSEEEVGAAVRALKRG